MYIFTGRLFTGPKGYHFKGAPGNSSSGKVTPNMGHCVYIRRAIILEVVGCLNLLSTAR